MKDVQDVLGLSRVLLIRDSIYHPATIALGSAIGSGL